MRVIRSSGSVRGGAGDIPAYSARDFGQARNAALRLRRVEIGEAGVAVGMQEAATARQQRVRVFGLAVRRITIEGSGRRRGAKRTLVAHRRPLPAGLGPPPARIEHRDRRVVGVQREARPNMALDALAEGFEQSGETADPARHDGAVDLDAAAGVDVGLPMQRQMIAVLRHDDMGEQRRPRTPFSIGSVGIGAWTTVSRARQLIFGRTCTTRLKWEGTYSSTSRSSAPIRPIPGLFDPGCPRRRSGTRTELRG